MPSKDTNAINPDEGFGQRLDNEITKLRLAAQFGAESTGSPLPAGLEGEWLKRVWKLESEAAEARRISVASFLGFPRFTAESKLADEALSEELGRVQDLLRKAGVEVTSLHPVPDREMYRFLTEDLPWEEIADVRAEGFRHQFVYEEFFPNEEFEVEHTIVEFFDMLFGKYYTMLESIIYVEEGELGDAPEQMAMLDRLCDFTDAFDEIKLEEFGIDSIRARKDTAKAMAQVSFTGFPNQGGAGVDFSGTAEFSLRLDRYGYWTIEDLSIPGLCIRERR